MKFQSVNIFLFIAVTGLAESVNSFCVVRNAILPTSFWYQCSRLTINYSLDVKRAPVDSERLSFTNSDIPVLRNASFSHLGHALQMLVICNCNLTEIEDKAFEGLADLVFLDLSGNKLTSVKGVWFEEIPKVEYVYLKYNQITRVDDNFYTTLPNLKVLDLANNQLKCLSVSSMSTFYVESINLGENLLTWKCISDILDWGSSNDIAEIDLAGLEVTYNVTKSCVARSPVPDPEEKFVDTCVEESLNGLLPAEGNYTIQSLCQFSEDKPFWYLDCST